MTAKAPGKGWLDSEGYRLVRRPGHPLARRAGAVLEHRAVLFDAIGDGEHPCHWCHVPLTWKVTGRKRIYVDHLDDNRLNNQRANLVPACLDCNARRGFGRRQMVEFAPTVASAVEAAIQAEEALTGVAAAALLALSAGLKDGGGLKHRSFTAIEARQLAVIVEGKS